MCHRVVDVERDYNETKALADSARSKALDAKRDSLNVYTTADTIRISRVNIDSLDSDSNQIKSDVRMLFSMFSIVSSRTSHWK